MDFPDKCFGCVHQLHKKITVCGAMRELNEGIAKCREEGKCDLYWYDDGKETRDFLPEMYQDSHCDARIYYQRRELRRLNELVKTLKARIYVLEHRTWFDRLFNRKKEIPKEEMQQLIRDFEKQSELVAQTLERIRREWL